MDSKPQQTPTPQVKTAQSTAEIQEWLVDRLAGELQIDREKMKVDQPILSYGIDSVQVVSVMTQLEDWGGFRFSENPLDDHPTIEALARHVTEEIQKK